MNHCGVNVSERPRSMGRVPAFQLMGIVNVTPDSFSDGGRWIDPEAAVGQGLRLEAEGAAIVDVGGESTRPGAEPVGVEEELQRVQPVVEGLASRLTSATISIDTAKAEVAAAALAAGATLVNDVTALAGDPGMAEVVASAGCDVCLMHMQGEPRTMQQAPTYGDVVDDVRAFLETRMEAAVAAGIAEERIILDPGIGFGKTVLHNLELLARLDEIAAIGRPVLLGTSRKRFIGAVTGADTADRLPGSLASAVLGLERGATVFRVHDVAPTLAALQLAAATLRPQAWQPERTTD